MTKGYGNKRYLKVVEDEALKVLKEKDCVVIIWQNESKARSSRQRFLATFYNHGENLGIKTAIRGERLYLWYEQAFLSGVLSADIIAQAEPNRLDIQVASGLDYKKPESIDAILNTRTQMQKVKIGSKQMSAASLWKRDQKIAKNNRRGITSNEPKVLTWKDIPSKEHYQECIKMKKMIEEEMKGENPGDDCEAILADCNDKIYKYETAVHSMNDSSKPTMSLSNSKHNIWIPELRRTLTPEEYELYKQGGYDPSNIAI